MFLNAINGRSRWSDTRPDRSADGDRGNCGVLSRPCRFAKARLAGCRSSGLQVQTTTIASGQFMVCLLCSFYAQRAENFYAHPSSSYLRSGLLKSFTAAGHY